MRAGALTVWDLPPESQTRTARSEIRCKNSVGKTRQENHMKKLGFRSRRARWTFQFRHHPCREYRTRESDQFHLGSSSGHRKREGEPKRRMERWHQWRAHSECRKRASSERQLPVDHWDQRNRVGRECARLSDSHLSLCRTLRIMRGLPIKRHALLTRWALPFVPCRRFRPRKHS